MVIIREAVLFRVKITTKCWRNIGIVLHGAEDTTRYGGLLICRGGTNRVNFANSDLSSITLYSYSNGSLSVATGVNAGDFLDTSGNIIGKVDSLHDFGQIIMLDEKVYLSIATGPNYDDPSYLVELTEDGKDGSAIVAELWVVE